MARKKSTKSEEVVEFKNKKVVTEEKKTVEPVVEPATLESLIHSIQEEVKNETKTTEPIQSAQPTNMKSFGYTWNGMEFDY